MTAEKQIDFTTQKTAAIVPVTTRAVGFYHCVYLRRFTNCTVVGQTEFPSAHHMRFIVCHLRNMNTVFCAEDRPKSSKCLFYRPRLDIEHRDVVKSMAVTFSPLANLIAGVGNFEYEGEAYYVKCPADDVLGILFSNLERVVDVYANPATPQPVRQQFYDLCPLPFANWNQPVRAGVRRRQDGQLPPDLGFPVLLNPEDFWPAGYDINAFEHDVHQVKNLISFVARKEIKMLREGASIDYEAAGHQRILVSNSAIGLRNPDRMFQGQWADEDLPQGVRVYSGSR